MTLPKKNAIRVLKWKGIHYSRFLTLLKNFRKSTLHRVVPGSKSKATIFFDHLYLFFILNFNPVNYYLFQFESKSRKEFREYLDDLDSPIVRNAFYSNLWNPYYSNLLHDKYFFHCYGTYHHLPLPRVYGLYQNGRISDQDRTLSELMVDEGIDKVVLKPVQGRQGRGIRFIELDKAKALDSGSDRTAKDGEAGPLRGEFLIQEFIQQHPALSQFHPHCVNSLRLITILNLDESVDFMAAMIKMGSDPASRVDNFTLGGIVVGVDVHSGKLNKTGKTKYGFGQAVTRHPLSGRAFENFALPFWNEILLAATRAQKIFRPLRSIGWDIAITSEGPKIIEGNIEYGNSGLQAATGGFLNEKNRSLLKQYGIEFYR